MKKLSLPLFCIAIVLTGFISIQQDPTLKNSLVQTFKDLGSQFAAIILSHNPKTAEDIKSKYTQSINVTNNPTPKVRVLIVPGHEPNFGGAELGALKERDMTLEMGTYLKNYLANDPHYEVVLVRDSDGWNTNLENYFDTKWSEIVEWQKASRHESSLSKTKSETSAKPTVYHNTAPQKSAIKLYGINKWSNENDIDIAIHIHFNDYAGRTSGEAEHRGFSIYVPTGQYYNSTTTRIIADKIFKRLEKNIPISTLPGEDNGIVDEEELIAIGSNNTSDAASMLIEYGYIYEKQFANKEVRKLALKNLAYQTYLGLKDFFEQEIPRENKIESPFGMEGVVPETYKKSEQSTRVFLLQSLLQRANVFPPEGKDLLTCPIIGIFGPCTSETLATFQKQNNIVGEENSLGAETIKALRRILKE
jgi:N-acetylmuramoyl-L-alanine amidase